MSHTPDSPADPTHRLVVTMSNRLAALASFTSFPPLTEPQAAHIDASAANLFEYELPPCAEVLADLEATALRQVDRLLAVAEACRHPLAPEADVALDCVWMSEPERVEPNIGSLTATATDLNAAIRSSGERE